MVGAVSSLSMYYTAPNAARYTGRPQAGQAQEAQRAGGVWTARRAASPETPVEPVRPVSTVKGEEAKPVALSLPTLRERADPAEMAVRMRMTPYEEDPAADAAAALKGEGEAAGAESAQKALEDGECETCERRKYQDGSDDMGVSFQTPTNVDPDLAASAVRGHEMEHVVRERAKATREDRKVVSQSVTYHTAICPECGKSYVSGGTTRTATKANPVEEPQQDQQSQNQTQNPNRTPFEAVA